MTIAALPFEGSPLAAAITKSEQIARRERMRDQHAAVRAGMSFEEFQRAREERVERWCELFHSEMERTGADPIEVLPNILAKVEESRANRPAQRA
jgi:hypothetical protein